uniref:Antimicrobial peptide scolopin-2 n=1 Tax=Scolopendra mutilans TaxID=2836329 RepID=AMP2_SCOMU|nr:RecName: Full=Antimicrobial peptide scolopin-2 [Scolopendra mutilans]
GILKKFMLHRGTKVYKMRTLSKRSH